MGLKEDLVAKILAENEVAENDWLSSGSTMLNLAASGHPDRALAKGKYFWIGGESSSGKTFLSLTCFAEACRNSNFDEYDLIFDNVEDGALMSFEQYFGKVMARRLQPPAWEPSGAPQYSLLAEEFYFNLDDRLLLVEKGKAKPFIIC